MSFFKAIANRWETERQERIEKEQIFDIDEQEEKLILVKRQGPVLTRAIPAFVFAVLWPLLNWHIYQSPVNRGTWVGWVILWCMIVPVLAIPYIRETWRVRNGDVWIIDGSQNRLERNGVLIGTFDKMKCVRAWTETDGDANTFSRLAIIPNSGKKLILGDYGNTQENWVELTNLAQRIAKFTRLPVEIQP